MADYTAWYRVGTVALTKNSKIVTGTGTFWLAAGLHTGDMFSTDCVTEYEIASVDSNTQITLRTAYTGSTTTETDYRIIRNFTASMSAETAANTAALLNDFRRFLDLQMQSIHGKSAYQIACEKGYVGTESQWVEDLKGLSAYQVAAANGYTGTVQEWLESLKAAGEWSTLDARTDALTYNNAGLHNSIYRGKNLGTFTADHLAAIRNGSFADMWIGDYFIHNGKKDIIAAFNYSYTSAPGGRTTNNILLYRATALQTCADYIATYNRNPSGTEGEEDYDPGTVGNCYATSNWFTVVRPKFIEELQETYSSASLKSFKILAPTTMSGYDPKGWIYADSPAHLPTIEMLGGSFLSIRDMGKAAALGTVSYSRPFHELPLARLNIHAFSIATPTCEQIPGIRFAGNVVAMSGGGFWQAGDTLLGQNPSGHRLHPLFCVG